MKRIKSIILAATMAASVSTAHATELSGLVNHTLKVWDGGNVEEFCFLYANSYRVAAFQLLDQELSTSELREVRGQLPRTTPGIKLDGILRAATVRDGRMTYTEHEIMIEQMHRMVSQDCTEQGGYR